MKVCLINPPAPYLNQPGAQVPLGLLYLAAVLEEANHSVVVKDYSKFEQIKVMEDLEDVDVYGITCTSLQLPGVNRLAEAIKVKYPFSKVFIGGPGTCTPEYVEWDYVDVAVQGEGEEAVLELLNGKSSFRGVFQKESTLDINDISFPARHLVSELGGNIFAYNKNYIEGGSTQLLTSRGCPFNCSFCAAPQINRKVRLRSVQNVLDEIDEVVQKFKIRQFRIADDTFLSNKSRTIELCKGMAKRDIVFRISTRVKPMDEESLSAMVDAGLKEISLGIESFDNTVLHFLNKNTTAVDNMHALDLCDKLNISTRLLMMIRTPFQTKDTIKYNEYFIKRVPFDIICCTHYLPLPGSDIWNNPENYRIKIIDRDLDHYNFYGYGPEGRREMGNVFEFLDRDTQEVNEESDAFVDFIESTGKVNKG